MGSWAGTVVAEPAAPPADAPRTPPPYYELYPDHLPYVKGEPIPFGYKVEKNSLRTWGIVTGSISLGVFYTYGLFSVKGGREGAAWLFLPVVGPSVLLFTNSKHCKPRCAGLEQGSVIVDAVGQAAGAALLIWGITSWRWRLTREDLTHPQAFVTPMPVGSGYGVGALGSF
jgi:hypothetical protein